MKIRVTAYAGLLVMVLALAGCGGSTPHVGEVEVNEASATAALSALEGKWRADNGADTELRIHRDAQCYFITQGEEHDLATSSDEEDGLTAQALCGPSRRIGSPEGHVWDVFQVGVVMADQDTVGFGESDADDVSGALNGRTVWRPDGKSIPKDSDSLQAPPAPPAGAGVLEISDAAPDGMRDLKAMAAQLIGPHSDFTVTGLATVPVITTEEGKTLRAADGEAFTVLRFTTGEGADYPGKNKGLWGSSSATEAQFFLGVGDERKPLELAQSGNQTESYIVASAPKDATLSLGLRVAGVDQVMSLPDGKVASGQAAAFYRSKPTVAVSQSIPSQELTQGDFKGSISATFDTAYLTAWDTKQGWAPVGQAWLELPFEGDLDRPRGNFMYETKLNPAGLIATVDGKPGELVHALIEEDRLVWQVPATAKQVKFDLTPKYSGQSESPSSTNPDSISVTAKGTTFTITFE